MNTTSSQADIKYELLVTANHYINDVFGYTINTTQIPNIGQQYRLNTSTAIIRTWTDSETQLAEILDMGDRFKISLPGRKSFVLSLSEAADLQLLLAVRDQLTGQETTVTVMTDVCSLPKLEKRL